MQMATMEQARTLLQEHFGYAAFYPGQEALIERLLAGQDVVGIMPTGAGKSICYQIPALLLPGVTVVVSPLISLMKDQVDGLRRMGLPAAVLNSSMSAREQDETYQALQHGAVKLLYIAPERLESEGFAGYLAGLDVSMVAVDEAHCVSQWGHDFRPSYRRIAGMIDGFATRPVVGAFTATATDRVREDVLSLLCLREPYTLTTGFDRPNLYFAVHAPADRDQFVLDYLRANADNSGIIYCLTRKQVDRLSETLRRAGFAALPYHAGLPDEERKANQEAFRNDAVQVVVATNAFGMGIDKSNVRFVLHCGMPKTMENYYQEAGRAGRDGERADCILLYSAQDILTNRFLIDRSAEQGGGETDKAGELRKLQQMVDYCNGDACLRGTILRYFGMEDVPESCGNCGSCEAGEETDITVEAQKILSCVARMENRFGTQLVTQVLRGSKNKRVLDFGFERLSTYGIMREYSDKAVKELISYLTARGYLEVHSGEFPVLGVSARGMRFLRERETLRIRRAIRATRRAPASRAQLEHAPLYETLRELRRGIAADLGVPPYHIFNDATLVSMCAVLPRTEDEMLLVSGVGRHKLENFGEEFLFAVRQYMDDNGIEPPPREETSRSRRKARRQEGEEGLRPTVQATYELYDSGMTAQEIAQERGITEITVEQHLVAAHRAGLPVNLDSFIPEEHRAEIFAAIEQLGGAFLRPLKEALPEEVSYTALRFAVESCRSRKQAVEQAAQPAE